MKHADLFLNRCNKEKQTYFPNILSPAEAHSSLSPSPDFPRLCTISACMIGKLLERPHDEIQR